MNDRQADASPVIEVRGLWKRFPGHFRGTEIAAVRGVSLAIAAGETVGLVGESGSGKTTVGRCIIGLEKPTSGEILLDGEPIARAGESAHGTAGRLQIVFQDPLGSLDPRMRLLASIEEPLRPLRLERTERRSRLEKACRLSRFPPQLLGRYPHELSAGQQQRACIARALITGPKLIVLDEPTSMLDAPLRAGLIGTLRRLQEEVGVSFLFITHDLGSVGRIAHRVLVMYAGRVVESGPPELILTRPLHPYTEALLASVLMPIRPQPRDGPRLVDAPRAAAPEDGCAFAPRCPLAEAECWGAVPELLELGAGHRAACFVRQRELGVARRAPLLTTETKGVR